MDFSSSVGASSNYEPRFYSRPVVRSVIAKPLDLVPTLLEQLAALANSQQKPLPFSYFRQLHPSLAEILVRLLIKKELYVTDSSGLADNTSAEAVDCGFLLCNADASTEMPLNVEHKLDFDSLCIIVHEASALSEGKFGTVYSTAYQISIVNDSENISNVFEDTDKPDNILNTLTFRVTSMSDAVVKVCRKSVYPPLYEWLANKRFYTAKIPAANVYLTLYSQQGCFVMPKLPGIRLWDYLEEQKRGFCNISFTGSHILEIAIKIAGELSLIHALGLIHLDCHPENILISANEFGEITISVLGFGLSLDPGWNLPPHNRLNTFFVSPEAAKLQLMPEFVINRTSEINVSYTRHIHRTLSSQTAGIITAKFDIYLFGLLLAWLLDVPVKGLKCSLDTKYNLKQTWLYFQDLAMAIVNSLPDILPLELKQLIQSMLNYQTADRPDITAVLAALTKLKPQMEPIKSLMPMHVVKQSVYGINQQPLLNTSTDSAFEPAHSGMINSPSFFSPEVDDYCDSDNYNGLDIIPRRVSTF